MRAVCFLKKSGMVAGSFLLWVAGSSALAGLPKPGELPETTKEDQMLELPKPGELPKVPSAPKASDVLQPPNGSSAEDLTEILKLPESAVAKMPLPGRSKGPLVACMQSGKMDILRPSLPLLSCWESAVAHGETMEDLLKACNVQMSPMKIQSTVVPKCMPKALGVCIGAVSGSSSGNKSTSDHYHYTPQSLLDWRKAKKNCEKAEGEWFGLGNPKSWF